MHNAPMEPYRVGIMGATGLVGQRLLQRLDGHDWFRVVALAASERSAGRRYAEASSWRLPGEPPEAYASMVVRSCTADALNDCDLVLSGLDAATAREVEPALASSGIAVVSNASAFRMVSDVPLVVPEVNASHLELVERQARRHGGGYIVTNPNCSVTGLVLALAPLHRRYGVRRVVVATMQALSGAGVEGPRGLEVVDNVIPYIAGEEEKMETEVAKLLGSASPDGIVAAPVVVSAACHRVPTLDGHLEAVSVELDRDVAPEEAAEVLRTFEGDPAARALPSSPPKPIIVRDEPDRPQPRLDREAHGGMAAVVGRMRRCPVLTLRFEVLSHNAVRGAAGGTVLNAELLAAAGRLPRRSSV